MEPINRIDEISNLLGLAVGEVFSTMLSLDVQSAEPRSAPSTEPLVAACVGFNGEANGVVTFSLSASFAKTLAGQMLGMAQEEFDGDDMVNDVVGELSNMIVGGVKSRLCDDGMPCVLSIPAIIRGHHFSIAASGKAEHRVVGFQCGDEKIVLELQMKPAI